MLKSIVYFTIAILFLFILQSCESKKPEDNGKTKETSKNNSDLVKQDDKGTRVELKYAPKVGEKLRYNLIQESFVRQNSPETQFKDEITEEKINYYYNEEVAEVSGTGVITYKMKFDSINISTKFTGLSEAKIYNSNVKDSMYYKGAFIQYNALIGQEFKMRVSAQGEIYDFYELEKVYDIIYKALGDTLNAQDKEAVKSLVNVEALKSKIQNQFQRFSSNDIVKDSSWSFNEESTLLVFPVKNILSYKLTDVKKDNDNYICYIDASFGMDFIKTEQKVNNLTIKIVDSKVGGTGNVLFNLTKGCITSRKTTINVSVESRRTNDKGQSAMAKENLTKVFTVSLL